MIKEPTITTLGGRVTCPRCQAVSKRSKQQCRNPSERGKNNCRFHGSRSTSAKTLEGKKRRDNARYVHGRETSALRDARKHKLRELRELEAVMLEIGMI
ncbi:hypothetical protein XMA121_000747 [Marinobacterium sp. xm-a-121]|nr:hypothetical protein [Marinobacterium sp. xm-a-152]NRP38143.1 hypothetical protein [Marinobacterium sp. xm-a-121]NRP57585.1 hypothetical protein [Marinobacterium sp. xm-d-510]NRP98097.1 hypothetical protein [Marinobacterium sp. xm-a-127]NRP98841.1 hypothetical protein [Marinobacterium sp. xm-v-233]